MKKQMKKSQKKKNSQTKRQRSVSSISKERQKEIFGKKNKLSMMKRIEKINMFIEREGTSENQSFEENAIRYFINVFDDVFFYYDAPEFLEAYTTYIKQFGKSMTNHLFSRRKRLLKNFLKKYLELMQYNLELEIALEQETKKIKARFEKKKMEFPNHSGHSRFLLGDHS